MFIKKTGNGFTSIELLAVIIILAAIALIVAPLVLDIIKEQKMKTFKESINGVLRSSRLELVNSGLSFPATFTYNDGKLVSPSGKELKVTGKIPGGSGTVTYKSEDNIELAIHDNDWCGTYNKMNKGVDVSEYDGTCEVVIIYTLESCFEFDESTGTITDYFRNDYECSADVVIPDDINGVPVEVIGESSFADKLLTSVVLPSELLRIEERAFSNSSGIGYYHESYQGQLLQATNKEYKVQRLATTGDNQIRSVDFSRATKLQSIGDLAFIANELTNVTIPSSVTSIGYMAFLGNDLTSLVISNSVMSIGEDAFYGNELTSVVIPDSVTSIGRSAFEYNQLTSVEIPDSVTSIGYGTFKYNQLTSVTIKGKSSSSDFTTYGNNIWGWASGYSDSNIIWNG